MCETVDAEVKTEALALTELDEAAAVTQMKPSDVSFFRLFDPPPDEPGDDEEKFASIEAPWRNSADDDVIEPEDSAQQDEDALREWKTDTLQILLSEVYPSAVTIYDMQKSSQ